MEVIYTKEAKKDISKLPVHIRDKILFWIHYLEKFGIADSRKVRGFNDESLSGKRVGQRSIRLSKGFRLFYRELPCEHTLLIEIIEVNKHEY